MWQCEGCDGYFNTQPIKVGFRAYCTEECCQEHQELMELRRQQCKEDCTNGGDFDYSLNY